MTGIIVWNDSMPSRIWSPLHGSLPTLDGGVLISGWQGSAQATGGLLKIATSASSTS
jgi:hypothetical protein